MGLSVALLLIAQSAASAVLPADEHVVHTPLESAIRGTTPKIAADIKNQARNFTPLVFARGGGRTRFHGYPMVPLGGDRYQARLPSMFLRGDKFEYFVEVRLETGGIRSFGSATRPFVVQVEEAKVEPVALSILSDPGAVVTIDGKEMGEAPLETKVLPGKHTVSLAHPDGRGAEQQIEITRKPRRITIPLPKAGGPGTLNIHSDPPGATVFLDDQRLGQTPFQGDIHPGKHVVVVERGGYVKQEREVNFREGHDSELSFSLAPMPKDPALSIESVPAGAVVIIDGSRKGVTPWVGPLDAGRHQVVLKKQGRREVASDFEMPEGRDLSLRLELPPPAASSAPRLVVVSKPEGATVKVDGKEVGATPWAGAVKAGKRALEVALEGHVAEKREVTAAANRELEVSFALQRVAGPAKMVVETEPAGADVSVDGEEKGKSPLTLQLAAGEHDIEASKDGFKGVAQKITVENGQHASLRLALAPAGKKPESIIAVATDPKGARLYVDGKLVGETPVKVKSTPGQHAIRVTMDGFQPRSAKIKLPEGKDFELRVAVSLKRTRDAEERRGMDPTSLARAQLKRAQSCDKQGDWDCALKYFQAVYDYKPVPELLFNLAQVRRKKGDNVHAANAYRAYLKEKPKGQLAKRAEELAKRCEEAAKGGAKNVAEDDTEAPQIKHEQLAKATRGHALRLSAVITDNKSGVFNPQACWRNVYKAEYECAPLVPVGQDEYAAEVPAKVITDGFAYYLEAYDNASNGPARSGAPEVPHSVSVDEAVAAPTEPLPEVARAEERREGEARPMPEVLAKPQIVVVQPPRPEHAAMPAAWGLLLYAGVESAVERNTDSAIAGRFGIEVSRRIDALQMALLQFDARTSRQPYRANQSVPGQTAPATRLDEQRYGARLAYGADFAGLLLNTQRLSLHGMALLEYQRWQNQVFPANYFGLGAHLQLKLLLPYPFALMGGASYTWNVVKNTSDSAVGTPRSDLVLRGGLELSLTERYALELTYRGDLLTYANDYRFTNGLSLGFGTTF